MSYDETILDRMLDKLPNNQAWFGANKAPNVTALMSIRATEVTDLAELVAWAKDAVFLLKARGDACDLWGRDLDLPRFTNESDEVYRLRMQAEILRPRNTRPSIEQGTKDLLGLESTVYEPWRDVLRFGQHSKLGKNKLTGHYYTNATIDVCLQGWHPNVTEVIERLRAAGVRPYYTFIFDDDIGPYSTYSISGITELQDPTGIERHDTFKAGSLYDGDDTLVSQVTDPNSPTFRSGGIVGYDRTP